MGRRLCTLSGMALAVVVGLALGAAPAPRDPPAPDPFPPPSGTEKELKLPRGPGEPTAVKAPADPASDPPAGSAAPAHSGPEAPSAGPGPGAAKPAAAKKAGSGITFPFKLKAGAPTTKTHAKAEAAGSAPPATPVDVPREMAVPADPGPPDAEDPAPLPLPEPAVNAAEPIHPAPDAETAADADADVKRAQAPATGPLPPAAAAPAGTVPIAGAAVPREPEPSFAPPAEKFPLGRQSVGLSVDVVAPQFLNLNQTATLKVVVRNNGQTDAVGVVVRDQLPEGLTFVSSQPEAQKIDALLSWNLGTIPAGSERPITLTVKPAKTGAFDHAATVTLMTGSRSRTIVREPKLKVEQTTTSAKTLKGQDVQFKIAVSNPGDGPVRNVTVQAKLTPGLRHETGEVNDQNLLEQVIPEILPGERVVLDPLVAEAVLGGEQSCVVVVHSPDVVTGSPDARSQASVTIVEPKLTMGVTGPDKRYTDTLATYDLALENPGTAPARGVRVQATLPVSGRLYAIPPGAQFDRQTRRLIWSRPQLDAGEKAVLTFQVRMGGIGLYQVAAEAKAEGVPLAKGTLSTDVTGLADVQFNVSEKRRVVDVNDETTYVIKVVNSGTKEATRLQISATISESLEPVQTSGTEESAKFNAGEHKLVFPLIERLGPGKSTELGIRVKAGKPGIATCRVFLIHDDLTEPLDDVAAVKVTAVRR